MLLGVLMFLGVFTLGVITGIILYSDYWNSGNWRPR